MKKRMHFLFNEYLANQIDELAIAFHNGNKTGVIYEAVSRYYDLKYPAGDKKILGWVTVKASEKAKCYQCGALLNGQGFVMLDTGGLDSRLHCQKCIKEKKL